MTFEPTWESLKQHVVPEWFNNAKLGVMIHWGPASIPAWAPIEGNPHELMKGEGFEYYFKHNPYVEWYYNTIRIEESPSQKYHHKTYGEDFSYFDFAPMFNEAIQTWNPTNWSQLFKQSGIKYVVFVTKHHDGFLLWPSDYKNPLHKNYHTHRDVVGELTTAVRKEGIRMGLYYSGGLDWTFNDTVITDITSLNACVEQSPEFVEYVDAHWRELISKYSPEILWGDIAYPALANLPDLFADYYNQVPDGVINDRFAQDLPESRDISDTAVNPKSEHYDFNTPEYNHFSSRREIKWESTRGLGYSYTYNMNETRETHLSIKEMVHLLVDIVSKNGNLLLGVTPMADGTIPIIQQELLQNLGGWLAINGEAIFDTSCWIRAEGKTGNNIAVRFTQSHRAIYAVILGEMCDETVIIEDLELDDESKIYLLGHSATLSWKKLESSVHIALPNSTIIGNQPAYAFKIISQQLLA